MKKTIISLSLVLILLLTSCSSNDEMVKKLDDLQQQQQSMQTMLDELSQRVAELEMTAAPQSEVVEEDVMEEVEPFDFLAVSSIEALFPYLPDGFVHPLPAENITRAVMIKETNNCKIILTYDQPLNQAEAQQYASDLNGELEDVQGCYGSEPCWLIQTTDFSYSVQNLNTETWYGEYLDGEISKMALTIAYPVNETPELSEWFNDSAFDYAHFLLPDQLTGQPDEQAVILGEKRENGIPVVSVVSKWEGFNAEYITEVFSHYQTALKDNEWFFTQGAPQESAFVYARLDEDRNISVKANLEGNGTHSCILTVNYSTAD